MLASENPDREVLASLFDAVCQYMFCKTSATTQVLETAIDCTGRYLSGLESEKVEVTTKVGRYTVKDIANTSGPVREGGDYDLHCREAERIELRAVFAVFSKGEDIGGQELKFARKCFGCGLLDFSNLIGTPYSELKNIEESENCVTFSIRCFVLNLLSQAIKNDYDAESIKKQTIEMNWSEESVGFEIDLKG